jgi:hypothetical protein
MVRREIAATSQALKVAFSRLFQEPMLSESTSLGSSWGIYEMSSSGATAPDKIIDELKQYDFEIISTNLPEEQENKLREAFAQE